MALLNEMTGTVNVAGLYDFDLSGSFNLKALAEDGYVSGFITVLPPVRRMIKFAITDHNEYNTLSKKDSATLYWLEDTKEIYKGEISYTQGVIPCSELPAKGGQGKIYVLSTTMKGYTWVNNAWKLILIPTTDSVTDTENQLSGIGAKNYIDTKFNEIFSSSVSNVEYNPDTKVVTFTRGEINFSLTMSKFGCAFSFDSNTGQLSLNNVNGTTLSSINIPLDNFIESGKFDDDNQHLIFTLRNGDKVTIPARDFVTFYNPLATDTCQVTIKNVNGDNFISVDVKISAEANNAIVAKADGLHVDKEALLKVADPSAVGNVITADNDGHSSDSGVAISTLSTNIYADSVNVQLGSEKLDKTKIISSIDGTDSDEVISEELIVVSFNWETL